MAQQALFEIDLAGGRAQRTYAKLLAPVVGNLDRDFPWDALDPSHYEPQQLERARASWTNGAFNEFCTATAMGQLVEIMGRANVPLDLWAIAASFPLEELLHVELCSRVTMRLGGGVPIVYDPDDLVLSFEPGLTPLQRANELIVRVCCVGEVFSLPMLVASMRAATNPLIRAVYEQIVRDEAMHGKLGWMYLDWIAPSLDDDERARLGRAANDTAAGMRRLWEGRFNPTSEQAAKTLADEVFGRLADYGITVPLIQTDRRETARA
jgi:hypothetical protein